MYTWRRRNKGDEQKSMIDYIVLDDILRKYVLDAKAMRGMYGGLTNYVVLAKIKMSGIWDYSRRSGKGKVSKVLASERMDRKEVKKEYERMVCERLTEARLAVRE